MKKKLTLLGFIGLGVLFGCSQASSDVKASLQGEMNVVSIDKVHRGDSVVLQHKRTGCYFTYVRGTGSNTSSAPTQIMIEKNGVTVPFCEK